MVWRAKLRWNHSGIFGDGALIFCVCRSADETSRGRVEMGSVGGGVEPAMDAAATTGAGGGSTGFAAGSGAGGAGGPSTGTTASAFSGSLGAGATGRAGLRFALSFGGSGAVLFSAGATWTG